MLDRARAWARGLKREVHALWLAARHPATPWHARALALAVAAYALSPIDLIPDFIPVLGLLDDLLILPLGIWLAIRLIPGPVMEACRVRADQAAARPRSIAGAAAIILLWLIAAGLCGWWLFA
jgi:uncharacterized membrane protein YkvA (DUF1232 family)